MMTSQEMLIIFIAVVLAASVVVFTLQTSVNAALSKGDTVVTRVSNKVTKEIEIISVFPQGTNTSVIVKGIFGEMNASLFSVLVDGAPVSVVSSSFVRDSDGDGYLDPGDTFLMLVSGTYTEENNCIVVDGPDVRALTGDC